MPGFIGIYNYEGLVIQDNRTDGLLAKSIKHEKLWLQSRTIKKFINDKLCFEDDSYIVLIEGVLFNKAELFKEYKTNLLFELVINLFEKKGESFFSFLRGSFSGILFEKFNNRLIAFTDHIGDKPVFYSKLGKQIVFGSELKYISKLLSLNNVERSVDLAGAYSALTYGYMISDLTYINNVKRLRGGTYMVIESDGNLKIKEYHRFNYNPDYNMSDNDIINTIDGLFDRAVNYQVEKNREYGYSDYAALSAGLDSRMTTFAISKFKNSDFTNYTYSPIGFCDQVTSSAIVKKLKNRYLFQSNFSGNLLLDIDGSIDYNEGLYMYFGAAVLRDFFKNINTQQIGLIHTGQIGDVIVGCFSKKPNDRLKELKYVDMHSRILGDTFYEYFDFETYTKMFTDREIYSIYNRGFSGVNSGAPLVFQQFTESFSPFCDVDFCEFCLTIPIEKRIHHKIYDRWILSKYPEAAIFKHNGTRVIGGRFNEICDFYLRAVTKIQKKTSIWDKNRIQSATPLNVWSNKEDIKNGLDNYFNATIFLLDNYKALQRDCRQLYQTGTSLEKNQVLTLLGAVKLLLS